MADRTLAECLQPETGALARVNYFPRQLLTAAEMVDEQNYFREKLRRHNRFLHGWGVVCGLEIKANPTDEKPWSVCIEPGYALGPWGDEIYVGERVCLDLAECGPGAVTDPCEPSRIHPGRSSAPQTIYIAIKYAECVARPVRVMPNGCGCDEEACEYSRVRDSFQIECLAELPPEPEIPNLCELVDGKILPPCAPCPPHPWVVLAKVTLSKGAVVSARTIDNFVRRQLYSTAVLQEKLLDCCCMKEPPASESANLEIQMEYNPVFTGATFFPANYVITVTNNGPSTARNVVVMDAISDEIRPIEDKFFIARRDGMPIGGEWVQTSDSPLEAQLGDLQDGDSVLLGFSFDFDSDEENFEIVNTATVKSDTPDPDSDNNTVEIRSDVSITIVD